MTRGDPQSKFKGISEKLDIGGCETCEGAQEVPFLVWCEVVDGACHG